MKIFKFFLFIILSLSISCKENEASVKPKPLVKEKQQVSTPAIKTKIDTSYKNNIRLYDELYYLMPSEAIKDIYNKSAYTNFAEDIVLTYKSQSITVGKRLLFKDNLLQSVRLSGDSFDGPSLLSLFKEKYGEPKVKEEKIKSDEKEIIATKILQYLDDSYTKMKYIPRIHKEVSNDEFQKHLEQHEMMSGIEANRKLRVVRYNGGSFYKIMKDITKNEIVRIEVEVAIQNNAFSKSKNYVTYTWNEGKKEIQLHYLKSVTFSGNKTYQIKSLLGGLSIEFSNVDDKINTLKEKQPADSSKQLEKKSLDAI